MGTGYEPLNRLKPVAADIWVVDGPAVRLYGMPFSTRMTIVRLASGAVWIHSPTKPTDDLVRAVTALGPVRHLIAPNWLHYSYIADWQRLFPDAASWAAPGVRERARSHGTAARFDHDLTAEAPEEWAGEIDQTIAAGSDVHREVVFFHRASRTLILVDLIENFEPAKLPWWMGLLVRFVGIADPAGKMPPDMKRTFRGREGELREAVQRMIDWGPERVILAHGRWHEDDGVAELRRAFRWLGV